MAVWSLFICNLIHAKRQMAHSIINQFLQSFYVPLRMDIKTNACFKFYFQVQTEIDDLLNIAVRNWNRILTHNYNPVVCQAKLGIQFGCCILDYDCLFIYDFLGGQHLQFFIVFVDRLDFNDFRIAFLILEVVVEGLICIHPTTTTFSCLTTSHYFYNWIVIIYKKTSQYPASKN